MSNIAKALVSVMCLAALSATALADTPSASDATKPTAAQPTKSAPAVTTGSIDVEPSFAQRVEECMAIWDRKTHMTKAQWKRSCRTTLQSLAD